MGTDPLGGIIMSRRWTKQDMVAYLAAVAIATAILAVLLAVVLIAGCSGDTPDCGDLPVVRGLVWIACRGTSFATCSRGL